MDNVQKVNNIILRSYERKKFVSVHGVSCHTVSLKAKIGSCEKTGFLRTWGLQRDG
jgi:hypothetical protein